MVTMQQFQSGLSRFIDTELTTNMGEGMKFVAQTLGGLFVSELPNTINEYAHIIKFFGVLRDGMIDEDKAYAEAVKRIRSGLPFTIKRIGTITITRENIDTLYRMIKEG